MKVLTVAELYQILQSLPHRFHALPIKLLAQDGVEEIHFSDGPIVELKNATLESEFVALNVIVDNDLFLRPPGGF